MIDPGTIVCIEWRAAGDPRGVEWEGYVLRSSSEHAIVLWPDGSEEAVRTTRLARVRPATAHERMRAAEHEMRGLRALMPALRI